MCIRDRSLSNIRNTISFISQFLKYLDGQSKKVTELEIQDIEDYVSVLDKSDIKYSTFNRYITHMHTFIPVSYTHLDVYKRQLILWGIHLLLVLGG